MRRRGVLKGLAATAVAPVTAASPVGRALARAHGGAGAVLREPGSLPYPHLKAGTDTLPKIEHIVVLMMENHSYNSKLGMLARPGADGFTIGANGKPTAANPYDHTSVLKLVETKWNLPALTRRDANAHNMLDFSRAAFAKPPALAKPLLSTASKALACNVSGPGTIPPPGSVTGSGAG